jgi:hypothetical protein
MMFEMERSNALIRIRWGKHVAHISKSKEQLHKNTHSLLFLKLKPTKRGIEFGIYFASFQKEQPEMRNGRIKQG